VIEQRATALIEIGETIRHRPELGFKEFKTAATVANTLTDLKVPHRTEYSARLQSTDDPRAVSRFSTRDQQNGNLRRRGLARISHTTGRLEMISGRCVFWPTRVLTDDLPPFWACPSCQ
jgi:metal-dependent amidase/aminoacylase/carboxypeptidase family protein